ncbi:flavoprotein [Candidatus Spyradosoma sp. SGI.093]|uniref:flavoprotein n=1 Tax=Candidatus Spyradosoma sp. SGI.093 TaxID=3420583 RepID=UPI003D08F30B
MFLENKKIALAVTGSIAAYKAADIASLLVKEGAEVQVLMTREAAEFITPLTLKTLSRRPVLCDLWADKLGRGDWEPEHIAVADWADVLLVAPATAHVIACFAAGLAPDVVTCAYLATRAPVVVAPAMNGKMLDHPATQRNLDVLRSRGNLIVEPATGTLACGYAGKGKLASPAEIVEHVANLFL